MGFFTEYYDREHPFSPRVEKFNTYEAQLEHARQTANNHRDYWEHNQEQVVGTMYYAPRGNQVGASASIKGSIIGDQVSYLDPAYVATKQGRQADKNWVNDGYHMHYEGNPAFSDSRRWE